MKDHMGIYNSLRDPELSSQQERLEMFQILLAWGLGTGDWERDLQGLSLVSHPTPEESGIPLWEPFLGFAGFADSAGMALQRYSGLGLD